jgi:hypothetical protein
LIYKNAYRVDPIALEFFNTAGVELVKLETK